LHGGHNIPAAASAEVWEESRDAYEKKRHAPPCLPYSIQSLMHLMMSAMSTQPNGFSQPSNQKKNQLVALKSMPFLKLA
jgi:hypothetical protein